MVTSQKPSKNWFLTAVRRHALLRAIVLRLEKLLSYRIRENLRQWFLRDIHEVEFQLFERVREKPGFVLDIGANRGHAAISVLRHTKKFRVVSLEPNPKLRWSLLLILFLHPVRFRFQLLGAGDQNQVKELVVPCGEEDLSSQATLDTKEFKKPYVKERLALQGHSGKNGRFDHIQVKICRVDELNLKPDVIKLDVEGWEEQALNGMSDTLETHKPMLIIEINNMERWAPDLKMRGYEFHTFENERLKLHANWADVPGLNVICIHPDTHSEPARLLASIGEVDID